MNDQANAGSYVLDEELLSTEELNTLTAEEKLRRINAYRAHIKQGEEFLLSENACRNSVFLLRAIRMNDVASNPSTKKANKPAVAALDLSAL